MGAELRKMNGVKSQPLLFVSSVANGILMLLMLLFSIKFSDYGAPIILQLSLHSFCGRSI